MATTKEYTSSKAQQWNRLVCDAIHYAAFPPTLAARALAIVHTAMYDAWTNFNDGGCEVSTTTGSRLKRPDSECTTENREKTYSHAAFTVAQELFCGKLPPEQKDMFREFMCDCDYDPNDKSLSPKTATGIGNLSGRLVLECRMGDGANANATLRVLNYSDFCQYAPVNPSVPQAQKYRDRWQPQLWEHKPQEFLNAHWGLVKPFALSWGGQFRPPAPKKEEDSAFEKQVETVLNYSKGLTDEQKMIAEFWAGMHEDKFVDSVKDDSSRWATPPGQICRIARYLSRKRGHKNAYDIKMFFLLGNALLDASIAAWDCKVFYDYVRPISAIHNMFRGKSIQAWGGPCEGTKTIEGENWVSYIPTPPFAEYVSGHSSFSAAAEEVLSSFCGNGKYGESVIIPKGSSKIEGECTPCEDVTLEWKLLKDAVDQAGISRLYGGIHFSDGNLQGRTLGSRVGCEVWNKAVRYFNGELG